MNLRKDIKDCIQEAHLPATARELYDETRQSYPFIARRSFKAFVQIINTIPGVEKSKMTQNVTVYFLKG